jgi:hypothetical protein
MAYRLLADVIVAAHLAYVGFVVLGQVAIAVGLVLKWSWIRNPVFRLSHLLAILIVAGEALLGIECPLTVWQDRLRELGGLAVDQHAFVERLLDNVLFVPVAPEVLRWVYVGFAALVLATLVLAPPRWAKAAAGSGVPGRGPAWASARR